MSILVEAILYFIVHVLFVHSQNLSSELNETYHGNLSDSCVGMKSCFNTCHNSSSEETMCQVPLSGRSRSSACSCSTVQCSRLDRWCVFQCNNVSSLSPECADCLANNNSDICVQTCFKSNHCAVSECREVDCHSCATGYFGDHCDQRCAEKCQGRCYQESGYCVKCERGKFGPQCNLECPPHCYRGACIAETGHCRYCSQGYIGTTCNQTCGKGYFGRRCSSRCSSNCKSGECEPSTGRCVNGCNPGYFNAFCDKMCPSGNYGPGCLAYCPVTCEVSEANSPCDHVNGTCLNGCNDGFQGEHCNVPCPTGTFGKNCQMNCSNHCFLHVCNAFSGHCLRCVREREGLLCETETIKLPKLNKLIGSDVTTDQVILIFIMLFLVGCCMWIILASSMYHRRKLLWQKVWEKGKFPSHYRLPRIWKQKMERAALSPVKNYYRLRRHLRSPEQRRIQRRRSQKLISSSESSEESETSSESTTTNTETQEHLDETAVTEKTEPGEIHQEEGGGDTMSKPVPSRDVVVEVLQNNVVLNQNANDGEKCKALPWITQDKEQLTQPAYVSLTPRKANENWESRAICGSGTGSSISGRFSNTIQIGSDSFLTNHQNRPLRLLKTTTRMSTATVRELDSSTTRFSITTEETMNRVSAVPEESCKLMGKAPLVKTPSDTPVLTESETHRSTETDSESHTTKNTTTEEESEESSITTSTSTVKSKSESSGLTTKKKESILPKAQEMPSSKRFSTLLNKNVPATYVLPPPAQRKPPEPPPRLGVLKKSLDFLARKIPIRIKYAVKEEEVFVSRKASIEKRHMSSRFLLTRLHDWRRAKEMQLEVTGGVVEIKDEKSSKGKSSTTESTSRITTSTTAYTSRGATHTPTSGETEETTRETSHTKTTRTSATSAETTTGDERSSTTRWSTTASSGRSFSQSEVRTSRRTRKSLNTNPLSTIDGSILSSLPESRTYSKTRTSKTASSSEPPTSSTKSKMRLESETRPHRKSRDRKRLELQRLQRKHLEIVNSLQKSLEMISPQMPRKTLQELHHLATEKLDRFHRPRAEKRSRSAKRLGEKERADVISYRGARKLAEGFWENTNPTPGLSGSTLNVSHTIGNQSSIQPSGASTRT
ncbi:hypothetical protein Bpfe_019658 [Biomphalaria pfeifferi]|uniref:EGF-like domain-containing protein n=1 Tax=Biomphalaria pfeifferi TaxID=112525 RepID=A0AAD8BB02_BIOPF|nr:hypothetical protein Bpfe_019658 [Biomphalaria pfeifferi]